MSLLSNKTFIERCHKGMTTHTLINTAANKLGPFVIQENKRGSDLIGKSTNQRTTILCQQGVKELLEKLGYKNLRYARKLKSSYSNKRYNPDRECDDFVREVKGRNRTTPGTAGEKVLGTPLKYSEVPRLYGKPLKIVAVGYQERELKNGFACGNLINPEERGTDELKKILTLFNKLKIQYLGFTDLLKKVN